MKQFIVMVFMVIIMPSALAKEFPTSACNQDVWKYVYSPQRLMIVEPCKEVVGRVAKVRTALDGDWHIELALDMERLSLLNEENYKRQHGNLVAEIVCANKTSRARPGVCDGCPYFFEKPKKGDVIRVWGSYVRDGRHGWMEIHPVMKLEIVAYSSKHKKQK